jgi:acetyl/propionyl-CoA carboxylase alpha subunit
MGEAAVTAGRAIGYTSAGTVEFILAPDGRFFFLEVNTRLQVEHPVTEEVTGLDLVAMQLAVADGRPLPLAARAAAIDGHAIEVRLCAEDPLNDYLPTAGTLARVEFPEGPGIRIEAGVESGDVVSVHYDSMLAKVIAHGATRADAVRRLVSVLRRTRMYGVNTNLDLLIAVLADQEFRAGEIDTHVLDRHPPASLMAAPDASEVQQCVLAAALADQQLERSQSGPCREAPSGWRNNPSDLQRRSYRAGERTIDVGYRLGRQPRFEVDGAEVAATVESMTPDAVDMVAGGIRRRYLVDRHESSVWIDSARAMLHLEAEPRFPEATDATAAGSLLAPMPGIVVRVDVKEGDRVAAGKVLLVLEAMKMEHPVVATSSGTITEVSVQAGTGVDSGTVLAVIAGDGDEVA